MADMVTFKLLKRSEWRQAWNERELQVLPATVGTKARLQWSGPHANNVLSLDKDGCAAYMEEDHTLCIYSRGRTIYLRDLPSAPGMLDKLMEKIDACRFPSAVSSVRADLPLMDRSSEEQARTQTAANSAARQAADAAAAQMRSLEQQLARAAEVAAAQAADAARQAAAAAAAQIRSLEEQLAAATLETAKTDESLISSSTPRPGALAVPMPPPPPPAAQTGMTEEDGPPLTLPPEAGESASDSWSLVDGAKGAGDHRAVAAALQAPLLAANTAPPTAEAVLAYVKALEGREAVRQLLSTRAFMECLVELVVAELGVLQSVGATTSKEIESKFAGAIALSCA